MRLRDLDAKLLKYATREDGLLNMQKLPDGSAIADADAIRFDCPLCRGHQVFVWFADRSVPADAPFGQNRWTATGQTIEDLTLTPSINLDTESARKHGSCLWHGWVHNGDAT